MMMTTLMLKSDVRVSPSIDLSGFERSETQMPSQGKAMDSTKRRVPTKKGGKYSRLPISRIYIVDPPVKMHTCVNFQIALKWAAIGR